MKTILYRVFFFLFMFGCLMAYIFFILLKPFLKKTTYHRWVQHVVRFWARTTLHATGSTVSVEGQENLPQNRNICFISNHQGMFDIPMVLGFVGISSGFIAKQELFKIPVLSHWMREIPCVFIDRSSARKAIESFQKSAEVIKAGHPMVIFPEGTRSRSDTMGEFHLGSLKLPAMANATIIPMAIKGSWRIMEIDKRIHKTKVKMRILPAIEPDNPLYNEKHALSAYLHDLISSNVQEM
ncbi:MAG: lysophospholipid acyltransferase family protein [Candidatus Cloacimonas sp.]|jgi:1-acyl-sn-glycerol-3-phosphate acyltransferase|nr:lysophospholipid acyltransferase family protein [Candidatus Cloacimonas sp.]